VERKAIISRNEGTNWVPAAFTEGIVGAHGGGGVGLDSARSGSSHIGHRFRQRHDIENNIPGTVTFDNVFLFSLVSGTSLSLFQHHNYLHQGQNSERLTTELSKI